MSEDSVWAGYQALVFEVMNLAIDVWKEKRSLGRHRGTFMRSLGFETHRQDILTFLHSDTFELYCAVLDSDPAHILKSILREYPDPTPDEPYSIIPIRSDGSVRTLPDGDRPVRPGQVPIG